MDAEARIEIISAFGAHLEARKSAFGRESELPYPKELIRQALAEELTSPNMPKLIDAMESGFLLLEDFVSDPDYAVVQRYESVLAKRGELLNTERDAVRNFAKEATDASDPMLAIMDRCLSQKTARMQQLTKMRAIRQRENG